MENELGKFLEGLRGKMSLRKAAEISGLSHTYIRDLELGVNRVTKTPIKVTPETLKKLSEAYNYSYDELMLKAGYIEENIVDLIDKYLNQAMDDFKKDKRTKNLYGDNPPDLNINDLTVQEKLEMLMVVSEDLKYIRMGVNEGGEKELIRDSQLHDIEDNSIVDDLNLVYKGMELTREEKIEFLSIARAIFDARRALKGKD